MDDQMVRAKIDLIKEFIRTCEARGVDPLEAITAHRESEERVISVIRPNDIAPDISQFQRVTDELKPKGKATNGNGRG